MAMRVSISVALRCWLCPHELLRVLNGSLPAPGVRPANKPDSFSMELKFNRDNAGRWPL
jgi:hypothetical protein